MNSQAQEKQDYPKKTHSQGEVMVKEEQREGMNNPISQGQSQLAYSSGKCMSEVKEEEGCEKVSHQMVSENEKIFLQICKLNRIPFQYAFQWIDQLKRALLREENIRTTSLNRIIFDKTQTNLPYLLSLHPIGEGTMYIKLKSSSKYVTYIKKTDQNSWQKDTYSLGRQVKGCLFLMNMQERQKSIQNIIKRSTNMEYIFRVDQRSFQKQEKGYQTKKIGNKMLFCPTKYFSKFPNLQSILQKYYECEQQEDIVTPFIGVNQSISQHPQWKFLLENIIRKLLTDPDPCSFQKIFETILKGELYLHKVSQLYYNHKNNHYPVSEGKKYRCQQCFTKSPMSNCSGCSAIQGRPIHLCIQSCFKQHHQLIHRLTTNKLDQVKTELPFCDFKCRVMFKCANNELLLSGQSQDKILKYYQNVSARLIKCLNLIAEKKHRQNEVKMDKF